MFAFLSEILQKKYIDSFAPLPLSACRVLRPYLLERAGIFDGTVILLAVPYYTHACDDHARNLSAYAVGRDYHLFFASLFEEILPLLKEKFPENRFAAFADHSPVDEVHAAAAAGLGVIGKNGLLLTEKYASYVFLAEIVTDAQIDCEIHPVRSCEGCAACLSACPVHGDKAACLSALTQKKGELTEAEHAALLAHGCVWGCDLCQEVCPYTVRAKESGSIYSPVPFFSENTVVHLNRTTLENMSDEEFRLRAYAWRKRETVGRNVEIMEKGDPQCSN